MSEISDRRPQAPRSLLTSVALVAAVYYLSVQLVLPYVSMWITGAESPPPVPSALRLMYGLLFVLGVAVYVTSSDERWRSFIDPVVRFLAYEGSGVWAPARRGVLIAIPLLVGLGLWRIAAPSLSSPTTIRIQHPTMPGKYEPLTNPFRAELAETEPTGPGRRVPTFGGDPILEQGTVLYQTNCRPCHGVAAGGDGPMARFFRLRPANFRDPGFIATVVEPYAFWRVSEGGPGLPPVATPWESAMPIWGLDLSEEERWKVLLAEYAIAGVEPRKPEKLE